jgi:hypothetical protein
MPFFPFILPFSYLPFPPSSVSSSFSCFPRLRLVLVNFAFNWMAPTGQQKNAKEEEGKWTAQNRRQKNG